MKQSDAVPPVKEANYIKRLELQVRLMADDIVARENQRQELLAYCQSPKFGACRGPLRGYVNVEDIILRLREYPV